MSPANDSARDIDSARARWLAANEAASKLATDHFAWGSGFGDPESRLQLEAQLRSARLEAERRFQEYHDLDRREIDVRMLALQRSQRLATWASFAVAAVVGLATVVSTLVALFT